MIVLNRVLSGVALVSAALILAPGSAHGQESGLPLGTPAPAALLQTLDGKSVNLATEAKGPAVIEFWAAWCENCEALLPSMKKAYAAYGSKVKFVAVAVSVNESVARVRAHVAKYKVPGEQLFDTRGDASDKWDVPATSYVVILDKSGKVVYTGVGGDQDMEKVVKKALNIT